MKKIFVIITTLLIGNLVYSQEVVYIKEKGYEGYIYPKEHSIWGFQPESNRYTPKFEDIAQAEKILRDSIGTDYVKSKQYAYRKPPINKRTLKKYVRQYVGYLTEDGEVFILIYFDKGFDKDEFNFSEDIMCVFDGGSDHWSIKINISTKQLFDMKVNGIS
ncbi:MAG: hypothetical protein J6X32_04760 [Salinivirgaceae bacterium]|nr:hypothetical protein [Salinivirgaceae bacterium]